MKLTSILHHAENGRNKHPELASRIDRAVALLKQGGITREASSDFLVPSGSTKGQVYRVNGVCQCPDYLGTDPKTGKPLTEFAPEVNGQRWCKHRLAMALILKDERYHQQLALDVEQARRRVRDAEERAALAQRELEAARQALLELLQEQVSEHIGIGYQVEEVTA